MTTQSALTPIQVLTKYFNDGEGKRPTSAWAAELKEFSADEKRKLAEEVCAVTGQTLL